MIVNAWKNTTPVCGFCDEIMMLDIAKSGFMYKCKKCGNFISDKRYEQMLDKVSDLEDAMYEAKEIGVLTNKEFLVGKYIKCKVIEDDGNGRMKISIRNNERK